MKKIILSITLLTLVVSCNAHRYGENAEPTQKSNLTFGMVKSQIKKGETTQGDILKIFGSPNMITKNKSNDEVWSYSKMSVQDRKGNSETMFGSRSSSNTASQSFDLVIIFNDKDIVKDYSVVSSSF